jgi:hypothetical protein
MKKSCAAFVGLMLVFAMAGAAEAKGAIPQSGQMSGPGLDEPMTFGNSGGPGGSSGGGDLNLITSQTKVLETLFGGDQMARPHGDLGPRYVITWTMRRELGSHKTFQVHSDLYPYAKGGAVVYTHGGQKVRDEAGTHVLRSGWAPAHPVLVDNLQALGLPGRHALGGGEVRSPASAPLWIVPAGVIALVAAAAIWARRRTGQVQTSQNAPQGSA